ATNGELVQQGLEQFLFVRITARNMLLLCLFVILWPLLFSSMWLYSWEQQRTPRDEALRIVAAYTLVTITTGLLLIGGGSDAFRPSAMVLFWVVSIAATLAARHLIRMVLATKRLD